MPFNANGTSPIISVVNEHIENDFLKHQTALTESKNNRELKKILLEKAAQGKNVELKKILLEKAAQGKTV